MTFPIQYRFVLLDDLHMYKFGDHHRCPTVVDSQQVEQVPTFSNDLAPTEINRVVLFATRRTKS